MQNTHLLSEPGQHTGRAKHGVESWVQRGVHSIAPSSTPQRWLYSCLAALANLVPLAQGQYQCYPLAPVGTWGFGVAFCRATSAGQ